MKRPLAIFPFPRPFTTAARWIGGLLLTLSAGAAAAGLRLELPEPEWILDSAVETPGPREGSLSPGERDLAAELRPLVDRGEYREALARLEAADPAGFSAAMHFVRGQLYLAVEDFAGAERSYRATLEQMPDFLRAHRALGAIYLRLDRPEQARPHITRAIELGAGDAQVYGQLGYLNLRTHGPWSAISGYQRALFLEPDNPQWRQGLLTALVEARQFEGARALLEDALAAEPDDAGLWLQHSNLALNTGDTVGALASLEIASRLDGLDAGNALVAAQLHLGEGSLRRGVALLEAQAGGFEGEEADRLVDTLEWLVQRREWDAARRLAAILEPGRTDLDAAGRSRVMTAQGRLHGQAGHRGRAIKALEGAIDRDPANGEALLALATLLREGEGGEGGKGEGDPYRAAGLYQRAAALPEFEKRASLGHAQLAVDRGDYPRALELLLRARELDPHDTTVARNIAALEQLVALDQYP